MLEFTQRNKSNLINLKPWKSLLQPGEIKRNITYFLKSFLEGNDLRFRHGWFHYCTQIWLLLCASANLFNWKRWSSVQKTKAVPENANIFPSSKKAPQQRTIWSKTSFHIWWYSYWSNLTVNIVPKRDDNTCFYYFLIVRCLSLKSNVGFLLVYLQRLTELPRETAGNVTACAEIVKRDVYSLYQEFHQIDFVLFWHINLLLAPSKFFRKSC